MRTRNALERLSAAGQPLVTTAESLLDDGEEERILERILASRRREPVVPGRRRVTFVLAGVAVVAAAVAVVAIGALNTASPPVARTGGHGHVALTGARIELAGYHFRTPAGFKHSTTGCIPAPVAGQPRPAIDGFATAAAADGACLELAYLVAGDWLRSHGLMPDAAEAVDVGAYQGYFVPPAAAGDKSTLYVNLPKADGDRVVYLVLFARNVTEDQLIAIAESGLPTLPPAGPTSTTGTETTG